MEKGDLRYADELFDNCQEAIEALCIGCPDERGWALFEGEHGEPCAHMVDDVSNCENPIVIMRDGRPYCHARYELHDRPELEKYEKRMRGDWS